MSLRIEACDGKIAFDSGFGGDHGVGVGVEAQALLEGEKVDWGGQGVDMFLSVRWGLLCVVW